MSERQETIGKFDNEKKWLVVGVMSGHGYVFGMHFGDIFG